MIHVLSELAALIAAENQAERKHAFDDLARVFCDPESNYAGADEFRMRIKRQSEIDDSLEWFGFTPMFSEPIYTEE